MSAVRVACFLDIDNTYDACLARVKISWDIRVICSLISTTSTTIGNSKKILIPLLMVSNPLDFLEIFTIRKFWFFSIFWCKNVKNRLIFNGRKRPDKIRILRCVWVEKLKKVIQNQPTKRFSRHFDCGACEKSGIFREESKKEFCVWNVIEKEDSVPIS